MEHDTRLHPEAYLDHLARVEEASRRQAWERDLGALASHLGLEHHRALAEHLLANRRRLDDLERRLGSRIG